MEQKSQDGATHSNLASLPPIPTPPSIRWREFRATYLPGLVFLVTMLGIWRLWVILPPSMGVRGIGEGAVSYVTAPQDGFLDDIKIEPYGAVEAGQAILTITPFDPRARLSMMQSQVQLSRLALEPSISDRNVLNYERLRVDSLRLKQELAMAKANLERAENVLPRHEALLKEQLISRDTYESTLRDRNFFQAEVTEKSKAIQDIDQRLEELRSYSEQSSPESAAGRILPELAAQVDAVKTNWNPLTLHAPISGQVVFYRRAREFVRAGEPIFAVNSPRADRIVAYVKQPIQYEPEVGMQVEVVTRANNPQRFTAQVAQVGARVEVITNAIAYQQNGALVDTGLPFILPVPENVRIRPGELVEVLWKGSRDNPTIAQGSFQK